MSGKNDDDKTWGVHYTNRGWKELQELPDSIKDTIKDEIYSLGEEPYKGESKQGKLSEFRAFEPEVDRSEVYRVAYVHTMKEGEPFCSVVYIGTREGFYDDLNNLADNFDPDDIF